MLIKFTDVVAAIDRNDSIESVVTEAYEIAYDEITIKTGVPGTAIKIDGEDTPIGSELGVDEALHWLLDGASVDNLPTTGTINGCPITIKTDSGEIEIDDIDDPIEFEIPDIRDAIDFRPAVAKIVQYLEDQTIDVPKELQRVANEAKRLDAMADAIDTYGFKFAGDSVGDTCLEWDGQGFDANSVDNWMDVGVWEAAVAAQCRDHSIEPYDLRDAAVAMLGSWTEKQLDQLRHPIEALCNRDMEFNEILPYVDDTEG